MMTRKTYREAAEVIRAARELPDREQLIAVVEGLADMFKRDNSRFDRERFRDAVYPPTPAP
jgi:hypothetical protein